MPEKLESQPAHIAVLLHCAKKELLRCMMDAGPKARAQDPVNDLAAEPSALELRRSE